MKKIFMGLAVVLGLGGAVATHFSSQAAAVKAPRPLVTLYQPTSCETIDCTSTALPKSCTDLKISCDGDFYSGNLKRNN